MANPFSSSVTWSALKAKLSVPMKPPTSVPYAKPCPRVHQQMALRVGT